MMLICAVFDTQAPKKCSCGAELLMLRSHFNGRL
jgi:hypothetical protein